MDFGQALTALKSGSKVTRAGWNGKGMFVVHQKGYPDGIAINKNTAEATGIPEGTVCAFRPYLMMRTVDGEFVPWVASQTDLIAEDWLMAGGPIRCTTDRSSTVQKPSIGRVVIALVDPIGNNGTDLCPAMITRVWSEQPDGDRAWTVNLKTIKDGNVDEWKTSVSLFETEDEARQRGGHTCFWPPRV